MAQGNPRCVAQFGWQARNTRELSISKSEHLTVIDGSGQWWKVRNDRGGVGFVPSNYVKELPLLADPRIQSAPAKFSKIGNLVNPAPDEIVITADQRTQARDDEPGRMYQQTDLQKQIPNGPSLNIKALAKFKFTSRREDELSLEKGDEIIILEKEADGWWRGQKGTRIGWFPFNYVQEIDESVQVKPQQPPAEKSVICSVVALYAFNSGIDEELVFQKGEQMDIVDQPAADPDWWEARKSDGSTGLIPRNYVEVVHKATHSTGAASRPPINKSIFPGVTPLSAAEIATDAVLSSDFPDPVDHSDAMDSLGTNVIMNITNLGAQGYPGTGKTSLLDLAMGKPAALTRNSTGCVDPPSRYLVTKTEKSATVVWDHVTTEKMFEMLCSASKMVIEEGLPSTKVKNPTTVVSPADSLPQDHEHSTTGGKEQAASPKNTSTRELVDTAQPGPSLPPPYTIFPELLTQLANSRRSGVIFDSHWMMVTDSGGQPPFLDASVLFLRNSCLEIFPLKLNECLDEKPKFSFFIDGKPATIATSCLPLSNLQVIETLAKAVAAFQPPHTASAVESPKGAKFAIVGTFEDKKDECTETLDQKERILEEVLEPYKHNLVRSLQDKVILPVNAVTTDEVERTRYSENLQKLITHASGVTLKVEVKLRWFGLLLSLLTLSEKKEKPILELDECFKIGSSLEMDESETLRAIRFFHDIGVIMHFDTPKLENVVIVNAKPVLDKVSQLISVPFTSLEFLDKYYGIIPPAQAKERLQQHGRFDQELLKALKFTEPITTQMFLDILEHVKAVVAVNGDDKHEYFMPCALDYASAEQCVPRSCSGHPPWVIRFRISRGNDVFFIPLPVGYLPVLVIFLLTMFPSEFSTGRDAKSRQYRNSINLQYKKGKVGRVYIVECHLQLEVYFTFAERLPQECLRIRKCILEAMRLTEERLRITEGSITKVDCFLCSCEERSAHISHVGEYSCELEGVVCEKTEELSSCNDKCLHWIPQDQRSQTDEADSGKETAIPTHEDKPTMSTSVSTSKEACAKKDITSNTCTPIPTYGPRPTINELISMERRDGSRKKLEIIDEITSHKSTQCTDFAHKLLNHRSTVRRLQKNHTNDEEFIRAVLNNWLDRDDDDEHEESVPCSWEALIQCMNDAGLDGELVKLLRDNVPRDC